MTERDDREGETPTGFPEPPGRDPDDRTRDREPHHTLSNPATDPDPTEWPDPYERREDPRDPEDPDGRPFGEEPHPPSGARSTSEPHPKDDVESDRGDAPDLDKMDE